MSPVHFQIKVFHFLNIPGRLMYISVDPNVSENYTSVDPDVSENLSVSIPIYFPSEICQK
jgi:hypothetical protein